jgi:predicted O-methyltransferase YrrM
MTSDRFFDSYANMLDRNQFDFIYIDGDHTADQVWKDGAKGWKYLKQGGILAFDDYEWDAGKGPQHNPKQGIDTFLEVHDGEYELLAKNWQVWLRKL